MLSNVELFTKNNPDSKLKNIHIVDTDKRVIGTVQKAYRKLLNSGDNVPVTKGKLNLPTPSEVNHFHQKPYAANQSSLPTGALKLQKQTPQPLVRSVRQLSSGQIDQLSFVNSIRRPNPTGQMKNNVQVAVGALPEEYRYAGESTWTEHTPIPETRSKDLSKTIKTVKISKEMSTKGCPICLEALENALSLPCGHLLCKDCFESLEKHKKQCPLCNVPFGIITGTQPPGTMLYRSVKQALPGFEGNGTIQIVYSIDGGIQGVCMSNNICSQPK